MVELRATGVYFQNLILEHIRAQTPVPQTLRTLQIVEWKIRRSLQILLTLDRPFAAA